MKTVIFMNRLLNNTSVLGFLARYPNSVTLFTAEMYDKQPGFQHGSA